MMREVIIDGVRYVPKTLAPPLVPAATPQEEAARHVAAVWRCDPLRCVLCGGPAVYMVTQAGREPMAVCGRVACPSGPLTEARCGSYGDCLLREGCSCVPF